jgi:hypothetical protein
MIGDTCQGVPFFDHGPSCGLSARRPFPYAKRRTGNRHSVWQHGLWRGVGEGGLGGRFWLVRHA